MTSLERMVRDNSVPHRVQCKRDPRGGHRWARAAALTFQMIYQQPIRYEYRLIKPLNVALGLSHLRQSNWVICRLAAGGRPRMS
jgi:hypothetical protein